jgi:DNA-binding response OmpR family regulator
MLDHGTAKTTLSILIVEDDEDTRSLLKVCLQGMGYEVADAPTMRKGLDALAGEHFDVLISDIGLPDGNGWDLLQQAEGEPVALAIAMSGFGQKSDRIKSELAGYRHHLFKPFDPDQLSEILEEFARSNC